MKEDKILFSQLSIPTKIGVVCGWVVGILYAIVFIGAILGLEVI